MRRFLGSSSSPARSSTAKAANTTQHEWFDVQLHRPLRTTDPKILVNCFTPASVPVLSSLAHYYGVCDHWFSSIPSQTLATVPTFTPAPPPVT